MDATQKEVFDIENLLFERLLTFKPAWENKNIDLVGSFAVNVFAIANQIQITRILDQMLLRAINRSPKGGEVYVELKADQEYVRIAVSDNGNMDDKFADHMDKIAEGVTEGYQKIEDGVVSGYKKIEDGVVEGFGKITDACSGAMLDENGALKTGKIGEAVIGAYKKVESAFVGTFMAKEGESVEDAKARMAAEQTARDEQMKADAEKRAADQQAMIDASLEAAKNAGKINK